MNRTLRLFVLGLALLGSLALAAEETQRYIVMTRKGASTSRMRTAANAIAGPQHRLRVMPNVNAFAADLTAEQVAELRSSSELMVEPVVKRYALDAGMPRLPLLPGANGVIAPAPQEVPWGITRIHAAPVWEVTKGENVNVVVADTGVDGTHPDLVHAYKGGYNALEPSKPQIDGHRHGTHVAGTIAAANNAIGVVGVAPAVKLWAVKVLADDGEGTNEAIINSLDWTIQKTRDLGGTWIVNMSLGSTLYSAPEEAAFSDAIGEGIVVIAAVGNLGMDLVKYPAAYPGVIGVGATTTTDDRADFSGFGRGLQIMAPGKDVRSTIIPGYDYHVSVTPVGTSAVAGTWRLIGAPYATATGHVIDCGIGDPEMFPESVRGQIALVRRGKWKFRELARNAKNAGAAAVLIETYSTDLAGANIWSLYPEVPDSQWDGYEFPLAVGVRYSTGEALLTQGAPVTVTHDTNIYGIMNGTSMATPHVTGVVALMLSLNPDLNLAQIEHILRHTADDLEEDGWDYHTGYGVVDALKAAQWVAPERFGVPPPPYPQPGRRRSVR